jgi:DNA-binding response OmpR family regulator
MKASPKILVVDDDQDILTVMELLFTTKGYDVTAISKGEEVFNTIETYHPDLVLLDVLISGNDGRDICKQLKTTAETKDLPVVMFSANASAEEMMEDYGADDFIHKPFDVDDLLNRIDAQLERKVTL